VLGSVRDRRWTDGRDLVAGLGRLERDPPMAFAVGVAGELRRTAKVEIGLPRLAYWPTAVMALQIEQLLWLVGFLTIPACHDLAHTNACTAISCSTK
jgi:hypothetical protein